MPLSMIDLGGFAHDLLRFYSLIGIGETVGYSLCSFGFFTRYWASGYNIGSDCDAKSSCLSATQPSV